MTEYFQIAEWKIAEFQKLYAPLNVREEIGKMRLWLDANPRRHKKNYNRFVVNWLNRAHASAVAASFERVAPASPVYRDNEGNRYIITPEKFRQYL